MGQCNGDGSFQAPIYSAVGGFPVALAVADVNGDGRPDVVTANASSNTISVLLGNGDGTFRFDSQRIYRVGTGPVSVAVADLTGDSVLDLAVANNSSNNVSVLVGNGDGTFQPAHSLAAGAGPTGIVAADVNGDGVPDLAVANQNDNTVSVLVGNGDGSFQTPLSFAVGAGPAALAAADFNGDQATDLVTANAEANTVSVLLNAGDWPVAPSPALSTGTRKLLPVDYPLQPGDQGQVTFPGGVVLITLGDQTITAPDTVSGITGSAMISVDPTDSGSGPGARTWTLLAQELIEASQSLPEMAVPTPGVGRTRQVEAQPRHLTLEEVEGFFTASVEELISVRPVRRTE